MRCSEPPTGVKISTWQLQHSKWQHSAFSSAVAELVLVRPLQDIKRFERKGLGYSKSLEMHKLAVAMFLGVYNFVRKHHTLGTTPAVAAGLKEKPWSLEQVVEMTADYVLTENKH